MLRVLVVEDIAAHQLLAVERLSPQFAVLLAGSIAAALAVIDQADLVVLDANLPNGKGRSPVETIRAATRAPILVYTAERHPMLHAEFRQQGADDVVVKAGGAELLPAIHAVLQRREGLMGPSWGEKTRGEIEAISERAAQAAATGAVDQYRRRAGDHQAERDARVKARQQQVQNRVGWALVLMAIFVFGASVYSDIAAKRPINFSAGTVTVGVLLAFGGGALIQGVQLDRILTAFRKDEPTP